MRFHPQRVAAGDAGHETFCCYAVAVDPSPGFWTVLAWATVAAGAAGPGALLLDREGALPRRVLGWANALAAGLMLGIAFLVMTTGLDRQAWAASGGAVLGVGLMYLAHAVHRHREPGVVVPGARSPRPALGAIAASSLHSAPEGIAIGVGLAASVELGVLLALTFAVHNVSEGAVLGSVLAQRHRSAGRRALLAIAANLTQVLGAVAAYALVATARGALPYGLGASFGALVYLSLAELLPESFRQTGRTSIAVVVSVAIGILALLGEHVS